MKYLFVGKVNGVSPQGHGLHALTVSGSVALMRGFPESGLYHKIPRPRVEHGGYRVSYGEACAVALGLKLDYRWECR